MLAAFLFAGSLVLGLGGFVNMENSGKADIYAESPKALADDVVDAVTDAYKNGENITQDVYDARFNN